MERFYKEIKSKNNILPEEPVRVRSGLISLEDLVVLKKGIYAEHTGDFYNPSCHSEVELIHQTLLLPLTVRFLKKMKKTDSIAAILESNKKKVEYFSQKNLDVFVSLSLIDAMEVINSVNSIAKKQDLKVFLPGKDQLEVLFYSPQYENIRKKLPPCFMPLTRLIYRNGQNIGEASINLKKRDIIENDEVLYLNEHADLLAGVTGHPWWYREKVNFSRHEILFEFNQKTIGETL